MSKKRQQTVLNPITKRAMGAYENYFFVRQETLGTIKFLRGLANRFAATVQASDSVWREYQDSPPELDRVALVLNRLATELEHNQLQEASEDIEQEAATLRGLNQAYLLLGNKYKNILDTLEDLLIRWHDKGETQEIMDDLTGQIGSVATLLLNYDKTFLKTADEILALMRLSDQATVTAAYEQYMEEIANEQE